MVIDALGEMKGLTLEGMRGVASTGRGMGKLNVCFDGERWLVVFRPPGGKRAGWVNQSFFLMSEKSGKPRRFARADTALRILQRGFALPGVWVDFDVKPWGISLEIVHEKSRGE